MRRLLILLTITVFTFSFSFAFAETTKKPEKVEKKINCCIKGDCKEMTRAECKKVKGAKVVRDCKDCKPPKATK